MTVFRAATLRTFAFHAGAKELIDKLRSALKACFNQVPSILNESSAVFPLKAKKVRICQIMCDGFAVKNQRYVKKVLRFLVTFSVG